MIFLETNPFLAYFRMVLPHVLVFFIIFCYRKELFKKVLTKEALRRPAGDEEIGHRAYFDLRWPVELVF